MISSSTFSPYWKTRRAVKTVPSSPVMPNGLTTQSFLAGSVSSATAGAQANAIRIGKAKSVGISRMWRTSMGTRERQALTGSPLRSCDANIPPSACTRIGTCRAAEPYLLSGWHVSVPFEYLGAAPRHRQGAVPSRVSTGPPPQIRLCSRGTTAAPGASAADDVGCTLVLFVSGCEVQEVAGAYGIDFRCCDFLSGGCLETDDLVVHDLPHVRRRSV